MKPSYKMDLHPETKAAFCKYMAS